jgi:hypothetical protein
MTFFELWAACFIGIMLRPWIDSLVRIVDDAITRGQK